MASTVAPRRQPEISKMMSRRGVMLSLLKYVRVTLFSICDQISDILVNRQTYQRRNTRLDRLGCSQLFIKYVCFLRIHYISTVGRIVSDRCARCLGVCLSRGVIWCSLCQITLAFCSVLLFYILLHLFAICLLVL